MVQYEQKFRQEVEALHLEVGGGSRQGLDVDAPLLRVQVECFQCPFLQHKQALVRDAALKTLSGK